MNNVAYYECKHCGTQIPPDTRGVFIGCKCGKLAIDGNGVIARIKGLYKDYEAVAKDAPEKFTYRIRHLVSGLYYRPGKGKAFNKTGKFYNRYPSLRWVGSNESYCVVEKYKISRVIN